MMADVVKSAIEKLFKITEPARQIAAWYDAHPDMLFLPKGCEELRARKFLTMSEVSAIVGVDDGRQWCRLEGLNVQRQGTERIVPFKELEESILSLLPPGFPFLSKDRGIRYKDALIVVRKNELHSTRATYNCMIEPVPTDTVNIALGAKDRSTIFDRFQFAEPDGSKIKVTTHQFRHYLNTIAKQGGLGELDIAKWSGRADVRQNSAYDHVTPEEMLIQIRQAVGETSMMFGPLGTAPEKELITRDEFARLKIPTAHTTELGFCIHDFTMSPCEIHRDCINCEELVCMKGDAQRNSHVERQLEEARVLLLSAEEALASQSFGADRWVEHQRTTVERLEQLTSILRDPSVPTGAFITLTRPTSKNSLESPRSVEGRVQLQLAKGPDR